MMEDEYRLICDEYHTRLAENIQTIRTISPAKYPILCGYMRSGMERKLIDFINCISSIPIYPDISSDGSVWAAVSFRQILRYGGGNVTWAHYVALWAAWGLIVKNKPRWARDNTPHERELLRRAEAARQYPETRYTIPEYTPELLATAEARAKHFKEARVSITAMTKQTLIHVYGSEIADIAYDDTRQRSRASQRAQKALEAVIMDLMNQKPYATKEEVEQALNDCGIPWEQIPNAWGSFRTTILRQHGLTYGRPTKAEVQQWSLPGYGYIIRRKE